MNKIMLKCKENKLYYKISQSTTVNIVKMSYDIKFLKEILGNGPFKIFPCFPGISHSTLRPTWITIGEGGS